MIPSYFLKYSAGFFLFFPVVILVVIGGRKARFCGLSVMFVKVIKQQKRACKLLKFLQALDISLEAATGFEPVNNGFADRCLSQLGYAASLYLQGVTIIWFFGAGNGTRTRDNHVGNVRLYQLSYSRMTY